MKKELNKNKSLAISMTNERGDKVHKREGMIDIATQFYENLYRKENTPEKLVSLR